jgi:hypothetical protein
VHLGETTPGDFTNDLRRRPWIRCQFALFSSLVARVICVIAPRAEYNLSCALLEKISDFQLPTLRIPWIFVVEIAKSACSEDLAP